ALVGGVVGDFGSAQREGVGVAVVVDGAAAAAAGGAGARGVGAVADGFVVAKQAIDDGVRDADAREAAAVGADVAEVGAAAEGAADDVDGQAHRLAQGADGGAAHVGADVVADVAEEAAVHDLEPPAAYEDGAAPAAVGGLALGVA